MQSTATLYFIHLTHLTHAVVDGYTVTKTKYITNPLDEMCKILWKSLSRQIETIVDNARVTRVVSKNQIKCITYSNITD